MLHIFLLLYDKNLLARDRFFGLGFFEIPDDQAALQSSSKKLPPFTPIYVIRREMVC